MDFSTSKYTAIISDLHLCEEEPKNLKNPLWKKYKTKEFFFDEIFKEFLLFLDKSSKGDDIELVLNGDIFDFDSVTTIPIHPFYKIDLLEKKRGLYPEEEKVVFQIEKILQDHKVWIEALSQFIKKGHRVIFVIGNHDLGLHFAEVQKCILNFMSLNEDEKKNVRFNEWFYISNKDTLIEHGNQYDPYCVCQDPVNPFIYRYNKVEIRLPLGSLATRYMVNGMGYVNPHVDSNYIMTVPEYIRFFMRYMLKSQPMVIWTWLFWGIVIMFQSLRDHLKTSLRDPLTIEDKITELSEKSNATPRMVRELQELFVAPAESDPLLVAKELWLDRAFIVLIGFYIIYLVFNLINMFITISVLWILIPMLMFFPFFLFYSKLTKSEVMSFKEPKERILTTASRITHVNRVVYGHSHVIRHEILGSVEHLNSGCWSPAFLDVECTQPLDQKTFVWIEPIGGSGHRKASVKTFLGGNQSEKAFHRRRKNNN